MHPILIILVRFEMLKVVHPVILFSSGSDLDLCTLILWMCSALPTVFVQSTNWRALSSVQSHCLSSAPRWGATVTSGFLPSFIIEGIVVMTLILLK